MAFKTPSQIRYEEDVRRTIEDLEEEKRKLQTESNRILRQQRQQEQARKEQESRLSQYDRNYIQQVAQYKQGGEMPTDEQGRNYGWQKEGWFNAPPVIADTGRSRAIITPKTYYSPGHSKTRTDKDGKVIPKFKAPRRSIGQSLEEYNRRLKKEKEEYEYKYDEDKIKKRKELKKEQKAARAEQRAIKASNRAARAEQRAIRKDALSLIDKYKKEEKEKIKELKEQADKNTKKQLKVYDKYTKKLDALDEKFYKDLDDGKNPDVNKFKTIRNRILKNHQYKKSASVAQKEGVFFNREPIPIEKESVNNLAEFADKIAKTVSPQESIKTIGYGIDNAFDYVRDFFGTSNKSKKREIIVNPAGQRAYVNPDGTVEPITDRMI